MFPQECRKRAVTSRAICGKLLKDCHNSKTFIANPCRTFRGECRREGCCLCHRRNSWSGGGDLDWSGYLVGGSLLGAVAGNVAGLAALVAGLASSVEGAAVGCGAVAGDVTELAAGIALHGLCLTITGEVVGATALVAGGRPRTAGETPAGVTSVAATGDRPTPTHTDASGGGASTGQVTGLAAIVAAPVSSGSAQAESRAVGLDMTQPLAVIALLSLGGARERALVGLVTGLLAVVAKALGRGADLSIVANVATLVASTTRQ